MTLLALVALAAQAGETGDAAVRRFRRLLERPETRARGVDRLSHLSPDVLRRAGLEAALVQAAEENAALAPSYGAPRLFSLDGREEELDDVLSRLERASGLVLQRSNLPKGVRVALRLEDASAFEALSELGRAASFSVLGVDGPRINLQPGVPPARPRSYHGPLMIEVERLTRRSRLDFDDPKREFRARFAVWWEPHVLPLDGAAACSLTRAVDDRGRSLLLEAAAPLTPSPGPRSGHAGAEVALRPPEPDARRLTLEGILELRLPLRIESADFAKAPGVASRAGVRVELRALDALETGGTTAAVRLTFDDAAGAEAYRPRPTDVEFLSDAPSRGLGPTLGVVRWSEREVSYEVRAPSLRREDVRGARVRVPAGSTLKRAPFLFEGIELR